MRPHPMTDQTSTPQILSAAAAVAAQEALAALDEAWAYYTPQAAVVTKESDTAEAIFSYYEAA